MTLASGAQMDQYFFKSLPLYNEFIFLLSKLISTQLSQLKNQITMEDYTGNTCIHEDP